MLRLFVRADDVVRRIEHHILWVLLAIIGSILLSAVFFRYVLAAPLTWTEELVTILFTWMVFVGASACFGSHQHIRVDSLPRISPRPMRLVLGLLATLTCMIILGVSVVYGIFYAQRVAGDLTPMMGVPFSTAALALPVASCCAILHVLRELLTGGSERALMSTMEMIDDDPGAPV